MRRKFELPGSQQKRFFRDLTGTVPKHTLRFVYMREPLREVASITLLVQKNRFHTGSHFAKKAQRR